VSLVALRSPCNAANTTGIPTTREERPPDVTRWKTVGVWVVAAVRRAGVNSPNLSCGTEVAVRP
jgi:hypothetical protein